MSHPTHAFSRRTALGLFGAAAAGAALTACSGGAPTSTPSAGGPVTLRFMFWGSGDRVERFQKVCAAFTEKYPNITVEPEFGAIDAIRTKVSVGMAGKNLPDVMWVLADLQPQLVSDGHLMDLTPHLGKEISDDGFPESMMLPGQVDGKQYAMVHGLQSVGVFAKKPMLEELGIPIKTYPDAYTWDEYAQICLSIHQKKGANFFGTDDPNYAGAPNFFRAYARQNGQDLWASDGDLGFTKELLTEWLTFWQNLRNQGGSVPTALALEKNPFFEGAPMIRGLSAYHMRNSNQIAELQTLSPEPLVLMPAPGNGGAGNENIAVDPNTLGVAANTKHPEEALLFANYLLNDPDRAKIVGTTIGAPPVKATREAIKPTVSEAEGLFLDYIGFEAEAKTKPVPAPLPTAGAFQSGMTKAIETLAYDRASIPETVDVIFGDLRTKLMAG